MLTASALYNMSGYGPRKEILRRVDHAMIFVMIAGTYTPFAAVAMGGVAGTWLMAAVWGGAAAGMVLKLAFPRRLERLGLVLYLALGWAVAATFRPLEAALSGAALTLLVAGGVIYTVGAGVHSLHRLPFHNAAWHALVLLAAACHFAAIWLEFA